MTNEMAQDRFVEWMSQLEHRHLADLTFPQVSRSLRALSSTYVERRGRIGQGAALAGAGKRAAFALFYGPLHFLIVRHIITAIAGHDQAGANLVDLGCGTGAAGAAWAASAVRSPMIFGVDRNSWAIDEARATYAAFGLRSRTKHANVASVAWPLQSAVVAAFTINELNAEERGLVLPRLLQHARQGNRILVVEPIAGFVAPWWSEWRRAFESAGGRADQWRGRIPRPAIVEKLDRAAGLNHGELTARSLWI